MTERNQLKDARRQIEQLLDHIDDDTDWVVIDYDPNINPYELTSTTLTVEYHGSNDD